MYIKCNQCDAAVRERDFEAHRAAHRIALHDDPDVHQGDPDFLRGLDELRALHLSKGSDYADASDPLRNYAMSAQDCGIEPWRAALLRLSEKYHRITNLLRKGAAPQHEAIEDTLMDLAALALIVRSLRKR